MTKSVKMIALFLAVALAQTTVITAGYADDENKAEHRQAKTNHEREREKEGHHDRNGVKSFTPTPIKTVTSAPITTVTSTPITTYTPTPLPTLNTTPAPAPAPAPATTKTWATYNQYCSGCHGTTKQGASAALIQTAINSMPAMSSLKSLTTTQIAAIAAGQ